VRTGAAINLHDLRTRIYEMAKSNRKKRFWGLYCHICKMETLKEAYILSKRNKGSAGIDGMTFEKIEEEGLETFLETIQHELMEQTYKPSKNRKVEIPKPNGKKRMLGIPTIKDRVVQGAIYLIIEQIFEADFSDNSYGYRRNKSAHDAVVSVATGITRGHTTIIDVDLTAYFDTINHSIMMEKLGRRINDPKLMMLIGRILKANGKVGVPQGGVISTLLSNIYLSDVDRMFDRAIHETARRGYEHITYARFADDIVIAVNGHDSLKWLVKKCFRRLSEEMNKLKVKLNTQKTKIVNVNNNETFTFLGFEYRKITMNNGKKLIQIRPPKDKVKKYMTKIKEALSEYHNERVQYMIKRLNMIIQGWVNYYRIGHCSKLFDKLKQWTERKVRRFQRKKQKKFGYGWKEWSSSDIYEKWGLYKDYSIRYHTVKA
jgi:RNA-directed DNA polymerase